MAEIEKKYSDYQTSECDTQETIEPIDEKLCPTCQINPDWKLPAAHWSMIQEAYLNESVCEYHVRVYEKEKAVEEVSISVFNDLEDKIKHVAATRILVDLDKPLNDGTRQQLMNAAFIVDTFRDMNSIELGVSYLVGVPAFNMDQIESNESENSEENAIEEGAGGEIIIDIDGFNRKLRQLRTALWTYEKYYSSSQKVGAGFVIRQENNETNRINYNSTRLKIKNFKSKLNDRLSLKGYPKIGKTGLFKSKKFKKIKFVFRANGKAYDLKQVFVLDADCDKYKKIPIPNGHLLRKPSMRVVYNFLENFDQVINDITAKETKPWLDFTLQHFYPKYIVDYGSIGSIDQTKAGLECLLELELGIGNGKVIDSLTAEIMSAFDTIEKQMAEEACRSLGKQASEGSTALAEKNQDFGKTPEEERKLAMLARYQKEFENKALKQMVDVVRGYINSDEEKNKVNKENIFKKMVDYGFTQISVVIPYSVGRAPPSDNPRIPGNPVNFHRDITDKESILNGKKDYADEVFNARETGKTSSLASQIQNSPHFQEAMDAANEVLTSYDNTFIGAIKNRNTDMDMSDIISAIGVCGMSKVAGKAMECLANGVSFDDFLDILINKTFEFMEVNTLGLFLNGLPNSFRTDLNKSIEEQFGTGVDISGLLGIKMAEGGSVKIKDFSKSNQLSKQVSKILSKAVVAKSNSFNWTKLSSADKEFLKSNIGDYEKLDREGTLNVNIQLTYGLTEPNQKTKKEASVELNKKIKELMLDHKGEEFESASKRIIDSLVITEESNKTDGALSEFEKAAKSFEETALGVKVDIVFDVVFDFAIQSIKDSFSLDELFGMLRSYPAVDFALDKIEELLIKPCPIAPIIYPPPGDFMKSLSVDVCDPTLSLTFPKLIVPNISSRFTIEYQFNEIFREAIIKLVSDIAISLLTRLMSTLESALCNLVEAAGGIVADGLRGNLKGSFYRALNEAFCNDGEDPDTSQSKAEELAEALFAPLSFDSGEDYTGAGAKVANIISSVASTEEFLESMVAREGEENDQFNERIANAVTALAPEMEVLLGDADQVAYFFKSLGSFLPSEDRKRIRDLLAAGVPNLPISSAICLTNDQLDEWNNMREELIGGNNPSETVRKLNNETEKALEDVMDDVATIETDGPFIGAATNESLKDVCNPNNLFNDVSQSPTDKALEDEVIEGFFDNISRALTRGFLSRGGILAEAMRDTAGRREFGRGFQKIFRMNYSNTQEERDADYNSRNSFGQFFMNLGYNEDEGAPGVYPETVAIKQRKQILEGGMLYDFNSFKFGGPSSGNVVYKYADVQDDFSYKQEVAASNLRKPKKVFGYSIQVTEKIDDEDSQIETSINVPVSISQAENSFMESKGFQYKTNEKQDIRKAAFQKILQSSIPFSKDFSGLYEKVFEVSNKKLVEALLTNYDAPDELPTGYKFGYVTDDLTAASFEYTPSPNEDELGTFASDRIIPLDPKIYGGRYSNPPYYVEPRKFTGWLELATSAFESQDGCDPKTPPLLSFSDIKGRVKNLSNSLRNDPRLSKSRDCVSVKPFHLLLDGKSKAKLDGVIRTTMRTYIAEFFMTGYGLFSNLQIRPENFDLSFPSYIAGKMKSEMSDLGSGNANKRVRIVRERYWYTFLEQTVEAYQRMIDVDGIQPPPAVLEALNKIQRGLDKYRVVDKKMKKRLRKELGELTFERPSANYDPITEINKGSRYNLAMSIAFRLADEDKKESFFNGEQEDKVKARTIRFASLKKLQFFQKIYFIKLFEKEALLVMSEFIRGELNRMSELVIDGPTDKPYYFDLYKSFFGMKSFFPESTSQVGLNSYYLAKQTGQPDAGLIPTIKSSNLAAPVLPGSEPQYIVESYVRLVEREGADIPDFIRNRQTKYSGAVSLTDMSEFVNQNLSRLEENNLSDYFGDLSFTYSGSFRGLMDKGFLDPQSISKLADLNKDTGVNIALLQNSLRAYVGSRRFEDFNVIYDETFLLEGETPTPTGTIGSTGVKYGLRVSIVLPDGIMSPQDIERLKADPDFSNKSKEEKSFLFEDGTIVMPLSSAEIDVVDAKFEDFDPLFGTERYDLECLVNKIVETPEFTTMFDKILNFRQASSMLAIYCMETLPASIGRDETERVDINGTPDVDDWDRSINKSGKNFLRREFKSLYLSNTEDGLSEDDDDDASSGNLIQLNNPFDFLALPSLKLPWWLKRRMKTKVYDANGQECADPEKDLL